MYEPSEVEEAYTVEESRDNCAEYPDPMSSTGGPAQSSTALDPTFVNFGHYDAAMVGSAFNPRDGPWSFNGSTYEGQQYYGQRSWQQPDLTLGPDGELLPTVIYRDEGNRPAPGFP
jgi:hypothetical protein